MGAVLNVRRFGPAALQAAVTASLARFNVGHTCLIVGDSLGAQNYMLAYIASMSRSNNIVSVTFTSKQDNVLGPGCPIQVENVPENLRGKRTLINGSGNTWTYSDPGPDFDAFTPPGTPHIMNLAAYASNGWFIRMNARAKQKFKLLDVVASVGRGTDEIVTRLPEALASRAALAFVMAGINDCLAPIPKSAADIVKNLKITALALRDAGKRVYLMTVLPVYTGRWTKSIGALIAKVNELIRKFIDETPGIYPFDSYAAVVDASSSSPGVAKQYHLQQDNLHLNSRGADAVGKVGVGATADIPFVDTRVTSSAECYVVNPLSSNILDSAPWGAAQPDAQGNQCGLEYSPVMENGATVAFSVVPRDDGVGLNNRLTYTPGAAGHGGRWQSTNLFGFRVFNNMRVYSEATVKTSGAVAGAAKGVRHLLVVQQAGGGLLNLQALGDTGDTGLNLPQEDVELVLRTPTLFLPIAPQTMVAHTGLASSGPGSAVSLEMGRAKVEVQAA